MHSTPDVLQVNASACLPSCRTAASGPDPAHLPVPVCVQLLHDIWGRARVQPELRTELPQRRLVHEPRPVLVVLAEPLPQAVLAEGRHARRSGHCCCLPSMQAVRPHCASPLAAPPCLQAARVRGVTAGGVLMTGICSWDKWRRYSARQSRPRGPRQGKQTKQ